jgi:hypothetical protein
MKVSAILFLLAIHCVFSLKTNPEVLKNQRVPTTDCDTHFKEIIQIDESMMNDFTDADLRDAYKERNTNMAKCLEFFSKFLAKLDYYLNNIEGLDMSDTESEEKSQEIESEQQYDDSTSTEKRSARGVKGKHFWKRSGKVFKNKNFW